MARRGLRSPLLVAAWLASGACGDSGIYRLRAEKTPENPLAVRVSFETDRPTEAEVRFGHGGDRWRVRSDGPSRRHEILVIGLRPETAYDLDVIGTPDHGRDVRRTLRWRTPALPAPFGRLRADRARPPGPSWTLLDLYDPDERPTVAMVDDDGFPVWFRQLEANDDSPGVLDASPTDRGVLIGGAVPQGTTPIEVDLAGEVLWEGPVQKGFNKDGYLHHHLERLPDDTLLGLEKVFDGELRGDVVFVMRRDGTRVWSWNTFDHLPPPVVTGETHANWAHVIGGQGVVSLAALSQIVWFDLATGEVDQILGRGGDFTLVGDAFWFGWQHAPVVLPDDHVLVYDNGGARDYSRLVEYELDQRAGTATQVWSWDGAPDHTWEATAFGSIQPLADGGLFVAAAGGATARSVLEIDAAGEVIWELNTAPFNVYRARRITPPLIEPLGPED